MDPAVELHGTTGSSRPLDSEGTQRHFVRRKPIPCCRNEVADDTRPTPSPDTPSPSRPLMPSDNATEHQNEQESTTDASAVSEDASTFHQTDGSERYLPPKQLKPLTNTQISLLLVELLTVLIMFIGGIKGLTILPYGNIFSVPPIDQDCGGYSVPSVERSFYVNLQIVRNLSFSRAKLLDLGWDTIIGQGGRYLHGWVLYQVAASQLAWMMEYTSVPYQFQLDLLFSTVSLPALWSTIRLLSLKRPARTVFSAVWFLLSISYILAFSSIWSGATGYLNPSTPAYLMPDETYATVDSKSLRLCMTVDKERLNGTVPAVVQGPPIGGFVDDLSDITGSYYNFSSSGTDDWKDLCAYFLTKLTIQSVLAGTSGDVINGTMDLNDYTYYTFELGDGSKRADFTTDGHSYMDAQSIEGLWREFTGFQYPGVGQFPKFENGSDAPWFNVTFQLDTSINMSSVRPYNSQKPESYIGGISYDDPLETVPYNSTLWFNGSAISLDAPFLSPADTNDCEWFMSAGAPSCLCYGDTVLTEDFREANYTKVVCISEDGYVWGFSSVITLVGIILEVCWLLGCFGMWLDVHINSTLFRMNRPSSGVVRNILDVAGAIQRDLGEDTGAYKDRELLKALAKCPPVGFEVDNSGKADRIAMVSMPGVRRRRSPVRIESGRLYA